MKDINGEELKIGDTIRVAWVGKLDSKFYSIGDKGVIIGVAMAGEFKVDFSELSNTFCGDGKWVIHHKNSSVVKIIELTLNEKVAKISELASFKKAVNNIYRKIGKQEETVEFTQWDIVPVNTPVLVKDSGKPDFNKRAFFSPGKACVSGVIKRYEEYVDTIKWEIMNLDEEAETIYAYKPWFGNISKKPHIKSIVKVILRDGISHVGLVKHFNWEIKGGSADVLLYSLIN